MRLKVMCPNARIVWFAILMRRYWHSAQDGRALEKSRKRLNLLVRNFMQTIGGCVIRHSNIRVSEKSLYKFDGTHLSNTGNEVYLNNIQGAIELFLSNDGTLVFPPAADNCFRQKRVLWKALGSDIFAWRWPVLRLILRDMARWWRDMSVSQNVRQLICWGFFFCVTTEFLWSSLFTRDTSSDP